MRKIIISSNCQTGGLAAAFKAIFPDDHIMAEPVPFSFANIEEEASFTNKLRGVDVWITIAQEQLSKHSLLAGANPVRTIKIPAIGFSAFHPDLCYARIIRTGELTEPHYNSAIAVWAYKNRIIPQDAVKLFNRNTFRLLGYFDSWIPNVELVKNVFRNCKMEKEFNSFFLNVQRTGNFMHSINHPKAHVLARLGKVIASRISTNTAILDREIDIDDGLSAVIWPVYPEIAHELSLSCGGYVWKVGQNSYIEGLKNYLEYAYTAYEKQKISPEDLAIVNRPEKLLDEVLGSQVAVI